MVLKTPAFWYRANNTRSVPLAELALTPLSWLYDSGRKLKTLGITPQNAKIPVLCLGNIVSGGSGKTPAVQSIRKILITAALTKNPFILSRGYGGNLSGPLKVDPSNHSSANVGDEPLLLAAEGPVIVSRDRPAGARLAEKLGADLILMDDGFQNPSLKKDISFLVMDGQSALGNGKLLPAGPLREPLDEALERTDAVILIGDDKESMQKRIPSRIPVFLAEIQPRSSLDSHADYFAFAGIGRPEKFKNTLESQHIKIAGFKSFADHHPYTHKDIEILLREAKEKNAKLVTTEKDRMRIPVSLRDKIDVLPIELKWNNPERLVEFLQTSLKNYTGEQG
ncbi:MAG: tetraacyldisaccharide 4'-kinase [Alphaproteobacteria bacterium]|nr:tetraacyldisaccharide 4'-kinase [Alphaproteobacteria bacterium]